MEEIWKDIEGYPLHQVSNTGKVRNKKTGEILTGTLDKDGYVKVALRVGKGPFIHTLVCTAFHGPKPSPKHQVNHKDGIKENNAESNLEWTTSKKNIEHSIEMGLRKAMRSIKVTDTFTGEVTHLKGLTALVSFCGDPRLTGRGILSYYRNKLFRNRYKFELDLENIQTNVGRAIEYRDYVNNLRMVFATADDIESVTGYPASTALGQLNKEEIVLWNGVAMKYVDDTRPFPKYDDEDVQDSVDRYIKRQERKLEKSTCFVVKDYEAGEIKEFDSVKKAAEYYKVPHGALLTSCCHFPRLFRGLVIKRKDEIGVFPEYSALRIKASFEKHGSFNPVKVTNTQTGETREYIRPSDFAKELGGESKAFQNKVLKAYRTTGRYEHYRMESIKA